MRNRRESVIGVFESVGEARRAIRELEKAGIGRDTLAIHTDKIVVTVRCVKKQSATHARLKARRS